MSAPRLTMSAWVSITSLLVVVLGTVRLLHLMAAARKPSSLLKGRQLSCWRISENGVVVLGYCGRVCDARNLRERTGGAAGELQEPMSVASLAIKRVPGLVDPGRI